MSSDPKQLPSLQQFCVSLPLYARVKISSECHYDLHGLITKHASIDCFCIHCKQPSVFIGMKVDIGVAEWEFTPSDRTFSRELFCSRVPKHRYFFHFLLEGGVLSKIGQSPSMADISQSNIQHYKKVLHESDYHELSKAVGLASHGVGIGSFVYLRRIFERLVNEARAHAAKGQGWDDDKFRRARMDEKIELLKQYLPTFLVEQRQMYGVLSKGVHELSEADCIDAFPIVRLGIELILDQKLALMEQRRKEEEVKKNLQALHQRLSKGSSASTP